MPDCRNRVGHVIHLHLQFLPLRLECCHPVSGAVCLIAEFVQTTLQCFLKTLKSESNRNRIESSARQSVEQLSFKSVPADQDAIRTDSPVAMTWTPVLDVGSLAVAGDDNHSRSTKAANHESAEKVFGPPAHSTMPTYADCSESLIHSKDLSFNSLPELLGHDPPFRNLHPHPVRLRAWPAGLASGLGVPLFTRSIPDENTPVSFVTHHLPDRRWMPCPYLSVAGRLGSLYALGIQDFCDRREAIAIRIHIENAKNNCGLLLIEFQLHTTHCCAAILAHPGWIFDRNIAVAKTPPTGLHSLQRPPLLTAMYLFSEAHKELLVHHPVERQQRSGCFLPAIQALGNRIDKYAGIEEPIVHVQDIRQIASEARSVIYEQAVERTRLRLRRFHQLG